MMPSLISSSSVDTSLSDGSASENGDVHSCVRRVTTEEMMTDGKNRLLGMADGACTL